MGIPDFQLAKHEAKKHDIKYKTNEELIKNPKVIKFYEKLVNELLKDFAPFERPKKITLMPREFTIEDEEITPTLKLKRRVITKRYKDAIDAMYQ